MTLVLACVAFLAGMAAYFPVVFIRKMNKVLAALEKIEANTRGMSSAAGAGK